MCERWQGYHPVVVHKNRNELNSPHVAQLGTGDFKDRLDDLVEVGLEVDIVALLNLSLQPFVVRVVDEQPLHQS
eukprot:403242-Hanusia_phi.AAC.2